jgi:hypothetical protein
MGCARILASRGAHPSIQWTKLQALVEGASIAMRELWGGDG